MSLGCGLGVPFVAAEPRVVAAVLGLNGAETSNWDTWRNARDVDRRLSDSELQAADMVAADPTQPVRSLAPPWIA